MTKNRGIAKAAMTTPAAGAEGVLASTMPVAEASTPAMGAPRFESALPLHAIRESPCNPRKRFDVAGMEELTDSIRAKGVLTPLLVRPFGAGRYEIAAGHRRHRAATSAGLETVPAIVRDMDEASFLEVLVIENDQREDVHPLEEAAGFQALLKLPGYDVARIAARIGRSPKYVYDRLKLLELTPKAQELFLRELFSAGHAILLARLMPADQERAIAFDSNAPHRSGVFRSEGGTLWEEDGFEARLKADPYIVAKAVSVRELEGWISHNVRLEPGQVDPFLFPVQAAAIEKHADEGVILITRDYQASDAVRGAGKDKVHGKGAWERADGQAEPGEDFNGRRRKPSKECDHSQLALVACGPGQGETFLVCIAKEKCSTHWAAWQKGRKERQAVASSPAGQIKEKERAEQAKRDHAAAQAKEAAAQKAWKKAVPALRQAAAAIVRGEKVSATGALADLVVGAIHPSKSSLIPRGKTAEDLVRYLAFEVATYGLEQVYYHGDRDRESRKLSALGVDVRKILAATAPAAERPAVQTAAKRAGKKKARR